MWTEGGPRGLYTGCQSGSGGACPASGATPFAPDAPLPSTERGSNGYGSKQDLSIAFASEAEQQSEQQAADRQRGAQWLEAVQFGVGIAVGGLGLWHR